MELFCVDRDKYNTIVKKCTYIYNSSWFHEINKHKVDELKYFLFKTSKYKLALVVGIKGNTIQVPYSAPFSVFEILNAIEIIDIEMAIELLEKYCINNNINKILFRIPPTFYNETYLSTLQNVFLRNQYQIAYCDLNYEYFITNEELYWNRLKRNGKKNLKKAMKNNYRLIHCETIDEKKSAYDVIAENRKYKGYTLRMTWEEIEITSREMQHDFFILKLDDITVAAAVVFGVTDSIYQVIYWGDLQNYAEMRPMNYLAFQLYIYYMKKGIKVLDIGPSSECGVPNYGLCSFKESIGCAVSSKYTYIKELKNDQK